MYRYYIKKETRDRQLIEKIKINIKDLSSGDIFAFSYECGCCHRVYKTMPIPFDPLFEFRDEAYNRTFQLAVSDFEGILNRCQTCGAIVCDSCIVLGEQQNICVECYAKQQSADPERESADNKRRGTDYESGCNGTTA
jgi:hypothetical protein